MFLINTSPWFCSWEWETTVFSHISLSSLAKVRFFDHKKKIQNIYFKRVNHQNTALFLTKIPYPEQYVLLLFYSAFIALP